MAASVTSSVLSMNNKPPHAKKKLPRASVGGREGSTDLGGPSQRKKYVRHLSTENPSRSQPHSSWTWTCPLIRYGEWAVTTAELYLEDIGLRMGTHSSARDADNKGREGIEAGSVAGWFGNAGRPYLS